MSLHKIWLIARREFVFNFRRRSFLFAAFIVPLLVAALMVIVFAVVGQAEEDLSAYHRIGVVDLAGVITDGSHRLLVSLPAPFELISTEDEARAELQGNNLQGY